MAETQGRALDPNKPLTQQEAIGILIQAANLAQAKGVFNLDEAAIVKKAKDVFAPPAPVKTDTQAPAAVETKDPTATV